MSSRNALHREISPHLLAHAESLVEWHPWGSEILALAKKQDRPILVNIGSSSCHHTQVMLRDCFSDRSVAKKMNAEFLCIKVDKNEHPELDRKFQRAALTLSGRGGWPLTVFLTPDGKPFFAANFLPKDDWEGRPGFYSLLKKIEQLWKEGRETLDAQAKTLSEHLENQRSPLAPQHISEDSLRAAENTLRRDFDPSFGGFGRAPKFPPVSALSLLMRRYRRTQDPGVLEMITRSLDGMMTGGLYDHLGGGFFRYTRDREWSRPHFEKLLAENALLARLYLDGYQLTKFAPYLRVAEETLNFLIKEMQSPEGAFFTSLSAESEGVEGKYYLFTAKEVDAAVGQPGADHFCAFFSVSEKKSLPQLRKELSDVAGSLQLSEEDLQESIEDAREGLLVARDERPSPAVDDTILTVNNGFVIDALAHAAQILGEARYLECAKAAASFLLRSTEKEGGHRTESGALLRESRGGEAKVPAFLDDYASLARGLLALYEAGAGRSYLEQSASLTELLLNTFKDTENAGLNFSATEEKGLDLKSHQSAQDSSVGNESAIVVELLSRLAIHLARPEWQTLAEDIALSFSGEVHQDPRSHAALLCAVDALLDPAFGALICNHDADKSELQNLLFEQYSPNLVIAHGSGTEDDPDPTLGSPCSPGKPSIQVVTNAQGTPAADESSLKEALAQQELWRDSKRRREVGRMKLLGHATPEGSQAFAKKSPLPDSSYTKWNKLKVSRLGLGAHRLGTDSPLHRASIEAALRGGINLIDTSPSFALGDSERAIGDVLSQLTESGDIARENLVVISKVGVHLGDGAFTLARLKGLDDDSIATPLAKEAQSALPLQPSGKDSKQDQQEHAKRLREGAFCISPYFLHQQITQSLERLGLEQLDFCLIQSPEHFLSAGGSREDLRELLLSAFSALEEEVSAGRITAYGVQSNTLANSERPELHLKLDWLLEIAQDANRDKHSLRLVEVPINLVERSALMSEGSQSTSFVEYARKQGVNVLATRPLTAFLDGALLRLADPKASEDGASADSLKASRYRVASLEAEFETTFAVHLRLSKQIGSGQLLPVSGPLGAALEKVRTRQQFDLAEATIFTPQLRQLIAQLDQSFGANSAEWKKFRLQYIEAIGAWLAAVRETSTAGNHRLLAQLDEELSQKPASPLSSYERHKAMPWAQKALLSLIETEELSGVLVGLRTPEQVEEALLALKQANS